MFEPPVLLDPEFDPVCRAGISCSKMIGNDSVRIKPRAILTRELAVEIYRYKIENMEAVASAVGRHASMLAGLYGVSEKTIRDIWTARTWSEATCMLEPTRRMEGGDELSLSRNRIRDESGVHKDGRFGQVKTLFFSPSVGAVPELQPIDTRSSDSSSRTTRKSGKRRRYSSRQEVQQQLQELEQEEEEEKQLQQNGNFAASDFQDPFHHDWPHWERSAAECTSVAPISCPRPAPTPYSDSHFARGTLVLPWPAMTATYRHPP